MAGIITFASSKAIGQYEYLTTLDYNNLTVNRIGSPIPGVTWINDNSTYDQNHQRFFFQGNTTRSFPWYLYTIDVVTGAVIYNTIISPDNPTGQVWGLQYDKATDTLYALYNDRTTGTYFSWIEPATGIVHPIKIVPIFAGYTQSAFDTKDIYNYKQ